MKKIMLFFVVCSIVFYGRLFAASLDDELVDYQTKAIMAIYKAYDSEDYAVQNELNNLLLQYADIAKTVRTYAPELLQNSSLEKNVMRNRVFSLRSLLQTTNTVFGLLKTIISLPTQLMALTNSGIGTAVNLGQTAMGGIGALSQLGQLGVNLSNNLVGMLGSINNLSNLTGTSDDNNTSNTNDTTDNNTSGY